VQWGVRYAPDVRIPELSLRGKNITQVELSEDTVICLSKDGTVYTLPIGRQEQAIGVKPTESSLFGFSKTVSPVSYRKLAPPLKSGER
jgi:alpha-tubulin suppressor-like RCC1 family protein